MARSMVVVRVLFGLAWLIDACLKWSPSFTKGFVGYISGEKAGQPAVVKTWLGWWVSLVRHDPHAWAYGVAVAETLIAVALIVGALSRLVCVGGMVFSLLVWATAEGLGGPYNAGSTDIGTSIIYALVFLALLATNAGGRDSLDQRLAGTRLRLLCARPSPELSRPKPFAVGLAALGVTGALTVGIIVAFVDAPAPTGSMSSPPPAAISPAVTPH